MAARGVIPHRARLSWDELIDIEVLAERIDGQSFTLLVSAFNAGGANTFRATITQVTVSPQTRRPVPLRLELRTALETAGCG